MIVGEARAEPGNPGRIRFRGVASFVGAAVVLKDQGHDRRPPRGRIAYLPEGHSLLRTSPRSVARSPNVGKLLGS
jgi:hypothetical protein